MSIMFQSVKENENCNCKVHKVTHNLKISPVIGQNPKGKGKKEKEKTRPHAIRFLKFSIIYWSPLCERLITFICQPITSYLQQESIPLHLYFTSMRNNSCLAMLDSSFYCDLLSVLILLIAFACLVRMDLIRSFVIRRDYRTSQFNALVLRQRRIAILAASYPILQISIVILCETKHQNVREFDWIVR